MFPLTISAAIAAALLGGMIGALRSLAGAKRPTLILGAFNVIVGAALAGMVTEHFMSNAGVYAAFGVGIIVGSVGAHALDVLHALVPDVVQRLLAGWVDKLGGKKHEP